jgi:hypothetical protein
MSVAAGLALSLALPLGAQAASGDLDATFGAGGKVTTDFAGDRDEAHGVVVQADGKLVTVGGANRGRRTSHWPATTRTGRWTRPSGPAAR